MKSSGDLRQQIRFCTSDDGVRLAFATIGRGPPLAKAANWLTHIEQDVRNPLWRPLLERLASGRTLIRYDQRGCGLSDREVADISFDRWVDDLEAVIEGAGLKRFALLGISQGAASAITYAVRHPERVSHLVLLGGLARGALRRVSTPEREAAARAMVDLVRYGWGRDAPSFRHLFSLQFLPHASAEQLRWFDELQRVSASAETAARTIAAFDHIDVSDLASRVDVPTLVLHSRHDARISFEEGRRLASTIPGADFVPLDSHNHVPLAGEPAFEEMCAAIAVRLAINVKTVRNHVTNIFDKLGVSSRAEAIVQAREAGFGRPE